MSERLLLQLELCAAAAVAAAAALAWNAREPLALGIAAGGAWSLASLWCLARLLAAWLSPTHSRRRVIGWLLVKLAVLYPLAVAFLLAAPHLAMSFGIGFTVALAVMAVGFACQGIRAAQAQSHGR